VTNAGKTVGGEVQVPSVWGLSLSGVVSLEDLSDREKLNTTVFKVKRVNYILILLRVYNQ
jgi:hypothetical protein